jgi:Thiamine pyrophosphate enzyme, N-terminal TPP binding domain/Helix-turn-helix domain of resolvase
MVAMALKKQGSRMNGAELLVAALKNEGVKQIFGLPGEENLAMVEALRRSSIKLVVTRHEQAAAFMAATHGRLTGEPGVCLTTLGPGALNLTTGATPIRRGFIAFLSALAEDERQRIVGRANAGRAVAKLRGVKFGRKPKLTDRQQIEGRKRLEAGESARAIARSFNVHHATVLKLLEV